MEIISEIMLFCTAVIWGVGFDAVYNVLRVMRQLFKHSSMWIGIEDFIYCIFVGVILFKRIFDYNDGIIRWYILFAAALGIFIHYKTMGTAFLSLSVKISGRIKGIINKIVGKSAKKYKKVSSKRLKKQ